MRWSGMEGGMKGWRVAWSDGRRHGGRGEKMEGGREEKVKGGRNEKMEG